MRGDSTFIFAFSLSQPQRRNDSHLLILLPTMPKGELACLLCRKYVNLFLFILLFYYFSPKSRVTNRVSR
jgi:hypothetical protein